MELERRNDFPPFRFLFRNGGSERAAQQRRHMRARVKELQSAANPTNNCTRMHSQMIIINGLLLHRVAVVKLSLLMAPTVRSLNRVEFELEKNPRVTPISNLLGANGHTFRWSVRDYGVEEGFEWNSCSNSKRPLELACFSILLTLAIHIFEVHLHAGIKGNLNDICYCWLYPGFKEINLFMTSWTH